jgi:putative peptidoglycan lipid II flippase
LLGHSILELVSRAFYAMQDTRTPVLVGVAAMSLNIVFSILFSLAFIRIGWLALGGLALANSTATALEALVLLYLIRRKLAGLGLGAERRGLVAIILAATAMAVILLVWVAISAAASAYLRGIGGVILGLGVYWGVAIILGVPDAREILTSLIKRTRT